MTSYDRVKQLVIESLELGTRAATLTATTRLLGALPELDSMAVVSILTAMEEEFGFHVEDDEINADTFTTLASLSAFVDAKLGG